MNEKVESRLDELRQMSADFAKAYGERMYLERFRESKLAILMKKAEAAGFSSIAAQEREAKASQEYIDLLKGLQEATEVSERLRWQLEVSKLGIAIWQTKSANERIERKTYGA